MTEKEREYEHEEQEKVFTGRLSRLEAIVETLGSHVEKLTTDVSNLTQAVSNSGKANWQTVASWAAVGVTILILVGAPILRDLDRLELNFAKERDSYINHVTIQARHEGYIDAKIETAEERINMLHKEKSSKEAVYQDLDDMKGHLQNLMMKRK